MGAFDSFRIHDCQTTAPLYMESYLYLYKVLILLQVEDALFEIVAEDFIRSEVIVPEVEELSQEVATEVLNHYDSKVMKREMKEV